MSTRALKKLGLRKHDIPEIPLKDREEEKSDSGEEISLTRNRFGALSVGESSGSEDNFRTKLQNVDEVEECTVTSKAKKKKKKKGRNVKKRDGDSLEEHLEATNATLEDLFPKTEVPGPLKGSYSERELQKYKLLAVDLNNLNAFDELKHIFGSKVVRNVKVSDRTTTKQNRGTRQRSSLLPIKKGSYKNSSYCGIIVERVKTENGVNYFQCIYKSQYKKSEERLAKTLRSRFATDVDFEDILGKDPYHMNTLINLALFLENQGEYALSMELLERAWFGFERACPLSFRPHKGNCQMTYGKLENRPPFVLLYKYMLLLAQKSCYRTAFGFSKVIFSLDPIEDPFAVVLHIDYLALRAKEYGWFIDFWEAWGNEKEFHLLPNMVYSLALAYYRIGNTREGELYLKMALMVCPTLLAALVEKCNKPFSPEILAHPLFSNDPPRGVPVSQSLKVLMELYVQRSYDCWNDKKLLKWIDERMHSIMRYFDTIHDGSYRRHELHELYEYSLPKNIQRHLMICGLGHMYNLPNHFPMQEIVYSATGDANDADENAYQNPFSLFFRSILPGFTPAQGQQLRNNNNDLNLENVDDHVENANAPSMAEQMDYFFIRLRAMFVDAAAHGRELENEIEESDYESSGSSGDDTAQQDNNNSGNDTAQQDNNSGDNTAQQDNN